MKRKRYAIDKAMKAYLATPEGLATYERHCAAYRPKHPGWQRTVLLHLIDHTTAPLVTPAKLPTRTALRDVDKLLYKAQKGRCYICRRPMANPNRDHVTPKSLGGKDYRNILLTHFECNTRKRAKPPTLLQLAYLAKINLIVYGT